MATKRSGGVQHRAVVPASGIYHDTVQVVSKGTAVTVNLPSPELRSLDIVNPNAAAIIYYGDQYTKSASVAGLATDRDRQGVPLLPGAKKEGMALTQANHLYFDSDTNGAYVILFGLVGHG